MKIDKGTIILLLKIYYFMLWGTLKIFFSRSGSNIAKDIKRPEDMSKIRDILAGLTDADIERVSELLGKGGKK
jgi:hypothetical protein